MSACPTRVSFYEKLANGNKEKMENQFKEWLEALEKQVVIIGNEKLQ